MVVPGETMGTLEEFVGGEGTFEDNGTIYASVGGKAIEDKDKKIVFVAAPRLVTALKAGDVVYGKIREVYAKVAAVEIEATNPNVSIPTIGAFIRISEVSRGYAEDFSKYLKIGDIIKAKVVELKELGIHLSIKETELGVVKAFCSKCRSEMENFTGLFACMKCGNREERRAAGVQEEVEERPQRRFEPRGPPRGGRFEGGRPERRNWSR